MTVRRPPRDHRPLREPADLTRVWQTVLAVEPLRTRTLWLLFCDDGHRPTGPLIAIEDVPDGPYDVPVDNLVSLSGELIDGPGDADSVAFLMARPGAGPWTVSDRAWVRFLGAAADRLGPTVWAVHWAHEQNLEPVVLP